MVHRQYFGNIHSDRARGEQGENIQKAPFSPSMEVKMKENSIRILSKLKEVISMTVKVIEDGDKSRKGNAVCPQCGKRVLIGTHFGDPAKCGDCGVPYRPILRSPKFS